MIPTLHTKNGLVYDAQSKAEAIANIFQKTHNISEDMSGKATTKSVNNTYNTTLRQNIELEDLPLITTNEIKKAIKKTKSFKSPGHDNIPNIVLKNLLNKAIVQLTYIYNACLKLSYFPKS